MMKSDFKSRWPLVIILLVMAALACTCGLPFNLGGNTDQPGDEPPDAQGLNLNPRGADGLVSGAFLSTDGQVVRFSVTADGAASYRLDGDSESQELAIALSSGDSASMTWDGIAMDGFGEKDGDQLAALANLMNGDLAHSLSMIPLDLACQAEGQIDPKQLAALLFPLQMYYKYQVADRSAISQALIEISQCNYGTNPESALLPVTQLYLTPANPVPVVFGYFPFDAEGAVEQPNAAQSDGNPACTSTQNPINLDTAANGSLLLSTVPSENEPIINQWGACEAMCRGACGADCTSNNCRMEIGTRCQKDEQDANTGFAERVHIYTCGLHPACIKHDACYDTCNAYWGCDTWDATYCRHGGWTGMENPGKYLTERAIQIAQGYSYCDLHTVAEERFIDVVRWVEGFGPKPISQVFIYTDETYLTWEDPVECPIFADLEEPEETLVEPDDQNTEPDMVVQEPTFNTYQGEVTIVNPTDKLADLTILESQVDLTVTDETVSAAITFSYRFYLYIQDQNNPAENCAGFFDFGFSGEGPLTNPLSVEMAQTHFNFRKEGPSCDKSTSDPGVGVISTTLTGSFNNDGSFSGTLDPEQYVFRFLGITADIIEE